MRAGIPLHPSAYDAVEAEQRRHGSSLAQATAASAKESDGSSFRPREERLLRSSLLLHPQPMALFSVDATFREVCEPSKSTVNALHSFERALDVEFVDWRQLVAVAENRRKMRRVMRDRYNVSAASGALTTNAVRMFLNFIKGHLAEMTDGLDWWSLLDLTGDMVTSLVKECRHLLTKAYGKTQAKPQAEERLQRAANASRALLESADQYYGLVEAASTDDGTAATAPPDSGLEASEEPQAGPSGIQTSRPPQAGPSSPMACMSTSILRPVCVSNILPSADGLWNVATAWRAA
ncbi:hypothetical protein FJT64_004112 [Amphibalanus amphitrite]|uniref:Uncharacterized protein n=1 Tax=Amphibalanus amphitrite TaxID=1232801 RepID=A0A6A4W667_AMPAM|nr:hypothetical protein FJT64_004112 [Amphibalanus amphitrite]